MRMLILVLLFTISMNSQELTKKQIVQLNRELEYTAYNWNGLSFQSRLRIKASFRRRYENLDVSLLKNEIAKDFYKQIIAK